jgi:tetratricopeptide (TPR) repeat protein
MRFSTFLLTALALGLIFPATASAQLSTAAQTGFVRISAPAPSDGEAAPSGTGPGASESGGAAPDAIDPEEEAMTLFRAGQIAFRNQDYRRALEFFQDAQSRHPSPIFHFNIGLCYEALEKPEQAIDAFNAYLRSGPDDRADIETKIAALEKKVEEQASAAPPPSSDPTAPGPEAPTDPAPPLETSPSTDEKPGRALVITGAVLAGVGGVLAGGVGTWQGIVALDESDYVNQVTLDGNPQGATLAETEAADDAGRRAQTIQVASIAAGAAIGLTGVALLVVGVLKNKKAADTAALQISPTADRTSAGLSLSGRF